jgi:hypothetical protein
MEKEVKLTKAVDFKKIIKDFNPDIDVIKEFDKHILSVVVKDSEIEVICSFWGIITEFMNEGDLEYSDAILKIMQLDNNNDTQRSDVTYFFYDDQPNPQLN